MEDLSCRLPDRGEGKKKSTGDAMSEPETGEVPA